MSHGSDDSRVAAEPAQSMQTQDSGRGPNPLSSETFKLSADSSGLRTPSESQSDEEYNEERPHRPSFMLRRRVKHSQHDSSGLETPEILPLDISAALSENSSFEHLQSLVETDSKDSRRKKRTYVVADDDAELKEILRRGLQREHEKTNPRRREKLRDMVFTRQFSAFDRQNEATANSPFHGFYVLFWISISLMIVKTGAENWRKTGSPLGTNEIMETMFRREVVVLLFSDGVMCGLTGFGWILQRLVLAGWIDWDRSGWIIQNIWQTVFIGCVVGLTLLRDWPWTHTVYFVLHGLVMLMKQHSYAFYNGHLSVLNKRKRALEKRLKQLETTETIKSPSLTSPPTSALSTSHLNRHPSATEYRERRLSMDRGNLADDMAKISRAIDSREPLDMEQVELFERMIKWETSAMTEELKGKATDPKHYYPNNLTFSNQYEFVCLPTLVYELEYPRSDRINWFYVAEKASAVFGIIFVMIMVSQASIYPVFIRTVMMKEEGWTLAQRFREFPWILNDLVFPFMIEYLLSWYLIWEAVLNTLAELTYFADRSFYDAWWNSVSWDQFARDWNRPVHNFLLRHVYNSSISSMHINKHVATLMTFFLSACVHELVMWCIFKKLRGYLLILQMCQLPLVQLSRTKWMRTKKTLGNMIFWVGIFTGPSLLCSLYLIL
ncbi:MBOAT family protein [Xylariales sp. PMI_506]|nr:MBOAT family protein [Xylariales sp. PMI_506]